MKKITAKTFQAKCLAIIDEVHATREPVLITKRGKPLVKLVDADQKTDEIFGFLRGKAKIVGDVVSPALTKEEWGSPWPEENEK